MKMKKIIVLVFLFILLSTFASADWELYHNMTFEGLDISDFNTSGSGWSIASSGCYQGTNCLYRSGGSSDGLAFISNSTFYLNSTTQRIRIKFWSTDASSNDDDYGLILINFVSSSSWDAVGHGRRPLIDMIRTWHWYDHGGGRQIAEIGSSITQSHGDWLWTVITINGTEANVSLYSDSSESTLYKNETTSVAFDNDEGYYGFYNYRVTHWDTVEFYKESAPNTAPTVTLNHPDNDTTVAGTTQILNATYSDVDSDAGTVDFINHSNSVILCSNTSVTAGTDVFCQISVGSGTELKWKVNVTDLTDATMSGIFNFSVRVGNLTVTWLDPTANDDHTVNTFKTYNANITCSGGSCFNVSLELDPTVKLQNPNTENLADAYFRSGAGNTNFGTNEWLIVHDNQSNKVNSGIKFNASVVLGNTVTDARLYLYFSSELMESGESQNISVHHIYNFPTYNISGSEWTETTITWNNRPSTSAQYNTTSEDTITITDGDAFGWESWNVTKMVKNEIDQSNANVSIMLIATVNTGTLDSTDYIYFASEENSNSSIYPYLNITYLSDTKSGAISTTGGATPFYTSNSSNPVNLGIMNDNDSITVAFQVNATGNINTTHNFYWIPTSDDGDVGTTNSDTLNMTIVDAVAVDTCTCTDNQIWNLDLSDSCILQTDCNTLPEYVNFTGAGFLKLNATLTTNFTTLLNFPFGSGNRMIVKEEIVLQNGKFIFKE